MKSDKLRLILLIAFLLTAGFLANSVISYKVAEQSAADQITDDALPLTSDNIYSEIQRDLLRPIFISSIMAEDTFVHDWITGGEREEARMVRYLSRIQDRYGAVTSYFISEKTRKYYHSTGVLKTVSRADPQDAWYFRVRGMQDRYEVSVDRDTADPSKLTVFINYRIIGYAGDYLGVIGVGLALNTVKGLVDNYEDRYGRQVIFVDRDGHVVLHSADYDGAGSLWEKPGMEAIAGQLLKAEEGNFRYRRAGGDIFVNSRYVPEFDWWLIVEQSGIRSGHKLANTLFVNIGLAVIVTGIVLLAAGVTVSRYQHRLELMASTDKLTGAMNRQYFDAIFEQALKLARRKESRLSLIMLDLDRFKSVNDRYGHLAGDAVLQAAVAAVRDILRESDVICRWGGEEFLLLLEDCDSGQAAKLAETVRGEIEGLEIDHGGEILKVTASLGVAALGEGEVGDSLLDRADRALLTAKEFGRNQVQEAKV